MKNKRHKIHASRHRTLKKHPTESNGHTYLKCSPALVSVFTLGNRSNSYTQDHAQRLWLITLFPNQQGCPLSHLLFILALEPFHFQAISIRNHPIIKGIQVADVEHRIALFADDTLLFLMNLEQSFSALADVINRLGKF